LYKLMQRFLVQLLFIPTLLLVVSAVVFIPDAAMAQVDGVGGFVPCSGAGCNFCHFIVLANSIIAWLIGVLAVVFGVMVFAAGIGLVTSGGNPSKLSDAKKSLTNALIGLIIVLAAWLIVDTLLKATLEQTGPTSIGPWEQIQCSQSQLVGDAFVANSGAARTQICTIRIQSGLQAPAGCGQCVATSVDGQSSAMNCQCRSTLAPGAAPGTGCTVEAAPTSAGGVSTSRTVQCPPGNSACSVSSLVANGLTNQQANVLSCIAMTESGGNPSTPPYNQTHPGSNSSACGTFQIVGTTWNELIPRTPPAFQTGCADHASSCRIAACNTAVVVALVKQRGFSPWTCPSCNSYAQGCINHYGG
jgi:hypothetical protein